MSHYKREWADLVTRPKEVVPIQKIENPSQSVMDNEQGLMLLEENSCGKTDTDLEDTRGIQEVLHSLLQQQQLWEHNLDKGSVFVHSKVLPFSLANGTTSEWDMRETKDLILSKAKLEIESPNTSTLWEPVSAAMKELGYLRSSEDCKFQWTTLVSQYTRLLSQGNGEKFPFHKDLDAVFQMGLKSQRRTAEDKLRTDLPVERSSPTSRPSIENENLSDEGESEDVMELEAHRKRRKVDAGVNQVLCDFIARQHDMEQELQDLVASREQEWLNREREWRISMLKLEQRRLERETTWKETQEQRLARQEIRTENLNRLLELLVNKQTQTP